MTQILDTRLLDHARVDYARIADARLNAGLRRPVPAQLVMMLVAMIGVASAFVV